MIESIILFFQQINPIWVYLALFFLAYIENLFPPSPSDIMIVAGGYLVGVQHIDFFSALIITTIGSTSGFMSMYKIGDWFGLKIIETRKIKFLPLDSVHKVEAWFRKYGYWLIVVNRFLSGTRAIVGFFAGMAEVKFIPTLILCFFSALAWNGVLIYSGKLLGKNWESIEGYLATYSKIVILIICIASIAVIIVWYRKRNNKSD